MNFANTHGSYGKWIALGVVVILVIVLIWSFIGNYNGLVTAQNNVDKQWSQVENVMQAAADKINNLVEVVKGYNVHEKEIFEKIADARTKILSGSTDVQSKLNAGDTLTSAFRSLNVIVENYPTLKADTQFTNLQTVLEGSMNRIAVERKYFIDDVNSYNMKVTRFPGNLFAKFFGFEKKDYFKSDGNTKIDLKGAF